jgi:transposase-like protein
VSPPLGGEGNIVEVDETFIGRKPGRKKRKAGYWHKQVALTLVDRTGEARSFQIDKANMQNIEPIVTANIARESAVVTDQTHYYRDLNRVFARHETINHAADEYVRGDVHTNIVEGYFSIFKRGMKGVYQHCSEKHLHRYLAEFNFRYNASVAKGVNDEQRAAKAVQGVTGKRLTYRTTDRKVTLL